MWSVAVPAWAQLSTVGPQSTIVISVAPTGWTYGLSVEDARRVVFDRVNDIFNRFSYGRTSLVGISVVYNVPYDVSHGCNIPELRTLANQAAVNAGITLSQYVRRIYFLFGITGCPWGGTAAIFSSYTEGWFVVHAPETVAHELGHTFGLLHAKSASCPNAFFAPTGCQISEYGNLFDIMGTGTGDFNLIGKEALGWVNAATMPPLTLFAASGTYTFDSLDTPHIGVTKGVKIAHSMQPSGLPRWLYLEYRQAAPYGVLFSVGRPTENWLLDATFETPNYFGDAGLAVGRTVTDEASQLTIQTLAVGPTGASVLLSHPYPTLTCAPLQQTVATTAYATVTAAGGSGTYSWFDKGTPLGSGGASFTTRLALGVHDIQVVSPPQTAQCRVTFGTVLSQPGAQGAPSVFR